MELSFIFCNSTNWIYKNTGEAVTRFVEGTSSSHTAVLFNGIVYEAVIPRSRAVMFYAWKDLFDTTEKITVEVPEYLKKDVTSFLNDLIRKRYSIPQLILILGLRILGPIDFIIRRKKINEKNALICTEILSRLIDNFSESIKVEDHDIIGIREALELAKEFKQKQDWKVKDVDSCIRY